MNLPQKHRILILASGRGSNFAALTDAVKSGKIPHAIVVALVCNNPQAPALGLASTRGIACQIIDSSRFRIEVKFERERYEEELFRMIDGLRPDFLCLAGYMLILGERILSKWKGKIVNIHPSLLPRFEGLHAIRQALEAGVSVTGCTVHWVTETLDGGTIIAQRQVEVYEGDTEDSLSQRLLPIEHQTYVEAMAKLCAVRKKGSRPAHTIK